MNIIDAVKSGKPFKRKNSTSWLFTNGIYSYSNDDVVADDWEVENQPVTITKEQFYEAWRKAVDTPYERPTTMADLVAKELGL